jgi:hypothetical protein
VQSVNGDIQDSASDFFCNFFAGENYTVKILKYTIDIGRYYVRMKELRASGVLTNTLEIEVFMQKTTIQVSIVHDGTLDNRAAILDLQEMAGKMAGVDVAHASGKGIKNLSEQGYKVFRARVCGITVEMAGDAHDGDIQQQVADVQATEV